MKCLFLITLGASNFGKAGGEKSEIEIVLDLESLQTVSALESQQNYPTKARVGVRLGTAWSPLGPAARDA